MGMYGIDKKDLKIGTVVWNYITKDGGWHRLKKIGYRVGEIIEITDEKVYVFVEEHYSKPIRTEYYKEVWFVHEDNTVCGSIIDIWKIMTKEDTIEKFKKDILNSERDSGYSFTKAQLYDEDLDYLEGLKQGIDEILFMRKYKSIVKSL